MFIITAFTCTHVKAQDTTALINQFNKVMSFTVRPSLYYSTVTKIESSPLSQPQDTATLTGEFYKNGNNVYSANNREIIFIDDSLFIEVNHERKSIWISRVNASAKEKMQVLPLDSKILQQNFRNKYVITSPGNGNFGQLNFSSRPGGRISDPQVNISLLYSKEKSLPISMETVITVKQKVDDEMIKSFEKNGVNVANAIITINNIKYLVRTQKMTLLFNEITYIKDKNMQMPGWKSVVDYSPATHGFSGKGVYHDYEITKMF